jgi:hypothetical protein
VEGGKLKKCISLSCWIKSVKIQIWYALGSCNGKAELLIEMILSIPQHVARIHSFPQNKHFKACHHGPLGGVQEKPWLNVTSLAWKKLDQGVKGFKYSHIKDLYQMTEHTFFGPPQARVRNSVADGS